MLMNMFETLYVNTNHELFVLANLQKKLLVMFRIFEVEKIVSLIIRFVLDKNQQHLNLHPAC